MGVNYQQCEVTPQVCVYSSTVTLSQCCVQAPEEHFRSTFLNSEYYSLCLLPPLRRLNGRKGAGRVARCDEGCQAVCSHSPWSLCTCARQLALRNKLGIRKHLLLAIFILVQSKSVLNHPSSPLLSIGNHQTGKQTLSYKNQ